MSDNVSFNKYFYRELKNNQQNQVQNVNQSKNQNIGNHQQTNQPNQVKNEGFNHQQFNPQNRQFIANNYTNNVVQTMENLPTSNNAPYG